MVADVIGGEAPAWVGWDGLGGVGVAGGNRESAGVLKYALCDAVSHPLMVTLLWRHG